MGIKRHTPKSMTWDHPKFEMLENEAGEWVRYDDHMEVMESIGAGGVSGRITKKTIEEHRTEFERFASSHGLSVNQDTSTGSGLFNSHVVGWMWKAWKAAKGAKE